MSNLGWYQIMTTTAKRVGGPIRFMGLLVGGGATVGVGLSAGVGAIMKIVAKELDKKKREEAAAVVHTVTKDGQSNEGLAFKVGDQFKILEIDGNAAMIEILGDGNNPYFVSTEFIKSISDYEEKM